MIFRYRQLFIAISLKELADVIQLILIINFLNG